MQLFVNSWFNFCLCLSFFLSIGWQALAAPQNPMDMLETAQAQIEASVDAVSSNISNLDQQSEQTPAEKRLKRQTTNDESYDENSDIIPDAENSERNPLGQHMQESLQKLADGMKNMWQNLAETMKQFVDSFRKAFGNGQPEQDYEFNELVTQEYENQI